MRLKHNKKRNTAFIYEALIRELTKTIIKGDPNKRKKIVSIVKEHFAKGTALSKELEIYKSLYETSNLDNNTAEKLMFEAKVAYATLNKKKVFDEQSDLIKKVNKSLAGSIFGNFVPNYRNLASLYTIFNHSATVKEKVFLEGKIVQQLTNNKSEDSEGKKDPIDNVVYKSFVKRFNEKYADTLEESQKDLLTKYVASFADDGLELKMFLNEEIGSLKEKVKASLEDSVINEDGDMLFKTKKVLEKLENYKNKEIDHTVVAEILKIQQLAKEIAADAD